MKKNVLDVLKERGYIKQFTHESETRELLDNENITFYIGFDPTADSLHVGHFIAMMFMAHMQKFGHRPIALVGGGTAMIGDPSGRTDMRKMMTKETIAHNVSCIKKQMEKFIDFTDDKALIVNNADWLLGLNYIDFIRDIGSEFSVNKMLAAECFKSRMEAGLSFLEFNYMLMQGYDFLVLNNKYDCKMQLGGDDQWSNMIAGVDLIRKKNKKPAFAMTCTLLTNSEGKKMGKTARGALWLDPEKTSPYEFYQYWRNVGDKDVEKCLKLLTFLPMDEINALSQLEGQEINRAKEILAFEITKLVHGEREALNAQEAARSAFGGDMDSNNLPTIEISEDEIGNLEILELLVRNNLIKSKGEGRKFIKQNGLTVKDDKVKEFDMKVSKELLDDKKEFIIKIGKKKIYKVCVK